MTAFTQNHFRCVTLKIETEFAPVYLHCDFDQANRLCAVANSTPGRLVDSSIDRAVAGIAESLTAEIGGIDA